MALGLETVRVGVFTDRESRTGCTVVLPPEGSVGGVAVRGGAPGTREVAVLSASSPNTAVHAVVLCGSSLFGLRAASGVADWCVEQEIGFDLVGGRFPIVGAAVVLDIASPDERRVTAEDGRAACDAASTDEPAMGAVGVGTGCTAGKEAGRAWSVPGGQGWAVARHDDLVVGALMAVNPVGAVIAEDGSVLAGSTAPADHPRYPAAGISELLDADGKPAGSGADENASSNTVIGCVVTNAILDKAAACRVADMAHTGVARSVSPAHTSLDGDAIFAVATGELAARTDLVAELAAQAVADAIRASVRA